MLLKFIISSFFIFSTAYAQILFVSSRKANFQLNISDSQNISIKGHYIHMTLQKNACNENIINEFISKTRSLIRKNPNNRKIEKELIQVKFNEKEYYEDPKSRIGHYLISLPREFHRLKIQEKILCSKISN